MAGREQGADAIRIDELELWTRIGVPDEERAQPQRLAVSLTLWPSVGFQALQDQILNTIDYAAVAHETQTLVAGRTDKLMETLAEAIASHVLATFPIASVRVELRKFILPEVKHVAVIITRPRMADE